MFRKVVLSSALIAVFAPALLAQGVTVCVFQGKESSGLAAKYASDLQNVADELDGKALPGGVSIHAVADSSVKPKEEDAAARSHQCGYIVAVWREKISGAIGLWTGSGVVQGEASASTFDRAHQNDTNFDYTLRRTGSGKKLINFEGDGSSPWDHLGKEVVKKLAEQQK